MKFVAFWFRRDLRLEDNVGLKAALSSGYPVIPIFIFDPHILEKLPKNDARVEFIHKRLEHLYQLLQGMEKCFWVEHGTPEEVWERIVDTNEIVAVYTNHDYEPYATERDQSLEPIFQAKGIAFHTYKDQVIFEKQEILSGSSKPYSVFTPYSKKWKSTLRQSDLAEQDCKSLWSHFAPFLEIVPPFPSLESLGFSPSGLSFPPEQPDESVIKSYDELRNFPAKEGTTRMGIHLRFGTISIRYLANKAIEGNPIYLNELIWREFYMQILWNFPHVAEGPFRKAYAAIPWRKDTEAFEKWCQGKTGFPIVDAGMRQLNETGYMHNRVRMITASFLVKDLLINWQWGEHYFAEKLLDFELASNNGGWQWAAGCGTDAAPYFRIFNPESQMKKFDPQGIYVRRWVPEFGTPLYPAPVVDHKTAREETLQVYKKALGKDS